MNPEDKGLVITVDEKGLPQNVYLDGNNILAVKIDVQYRPNQYPVVLLETYLKDDEGHLITNDENGLATGVKTFYAVTKEDFDLLQTLKAAK